MSVVNFKKFKYDIDQVLGHFALERGHECGILKQWLDVSIPSDYVLPELLEKKRLTLIDEVDVWNEEELKMHFLSFVLEYADFQISKKAKLFYERPISAVVQGTALSVICDALLASPYGINTPQKPYFFLQEFKKGKKAADDAEGQMLIAMLIAQEQNADKFPIYGCYLQGRYWYFATLQDKQYCLSRSYDATQKDELARILFILCSIKELIYPRFA